MISLNYNKKWQKLLTPEIVQQLTKIHEFKGEQKLYIEAQSDTLAQLVEIAKIQSTEASNKIEGIYTSDERLKKLVANKTTPKSRSEQEIAGYRDVLATVHESYEYIPIRPGQIQQLHRDLYKFSGRNIGGSYKNNDNIIKETDSEGNEFIRFRPVSAWETPMAMEDLCISFAEIINREEADPLLVIPMFVLDFLCIHPFNDGNGRMSRLLTLLLLYRAGYIVGKYVSIERLIETSKDTYYESLQSSSEGWHEGENDYVPFVSYTLGIILAAYREFSTRVDILINRVKSKPERVTEIIKASYGKITKAQIIEKCPDISEVTIQRTLNELVKNGTIVKQTSGRYASYIWNTEDKI